MSVFCYGYQEYFLLMSLVAQTQKRPKSIVQAKGTSYSKPSIAIDGGYP
jgi:hypothetical protein